MRWTTLDTVGFLIGVAVFVLPPILYLKFVAEAFRKPGDQSPTMEAAIF